MLRLSLTNKQMKVYVNGKYKGTMRDTRGRFAQTKSLIVRLVKYSLIVSVLYFGLTNLPTKTETVYADREVVKEINVMPRKIDALKDELINEISKLESSGTKTEDGLVVIDDNKAGTLPRKDKLSYGCMQFKVSTIQMFAKQVRNEVLNNHQAILLGLDCDEAKKLAKETIFKIEGALWHWSVATKEMGVRVSIIRNLES